MFSTCCCGSGLRAVQCCELASGTPSLTDDIGHLQTLVERAREAQKSGDVAAAEKLCLEVLELTPLHFDALQGLFNIRLSEGKPKAAEALVRRMVRLDPNSLYATNEVALLLLSRRALGEAEAHARNAVRLAPQHPQAHNLMGMILTESNRPQAGEYHYRRALDLSGGARDPVLLANLALNLRNQGRMEEARSLYVEAMNTAPDSREIMLGYSGLEEADRNFPVAAAILDRLDALVPGDRAVRLARATLLGRTQRAADAIALFEAEGDENLKPAELFKKGRLLDQLGRYDEAWDAFAQGKKRARETSGLSYRDDEVSRHVDALMHFFVKKRLDSLPRAGVRSDVAQPIFVLGFPRSGTTLVEQTLSAHTRIAAGDELPLVMEITSIMSRLLGSPLGYPEGLTELWMGDQREGLDNLRDYYLQRVRQLGVLPPEKTRFTDKMPLNETHLGLIALLFPKAPLIHVLRHPLDIMVSSFSNEFTHGAFCAFDLETAAIHYVRIANLVEHYCTEMDLNYMPLRYEELVVDQENQVMALLSFIGEAYEPACLTFHQNRRYARTASYAQVAEPLYGRSVYRYRHYLKQLEPVIPILEPVMKRLGYAVVS